MKKTKKRKSRKRKSKIFDCQHYEYLNWNFPVEFPPLPKEHGLPENHYEHPEETDLESICGGMDESQDVELYDGTLGVTVGFVQAHEQPVGQLQWNNNLATIYDNPGNVSNVRWCTGTLISRNLFLTAGHCFDQDPNGWTVPRINGTSTPISPAEIATNMHVNFNYQFAPDGTLRTESEFAVLDLVEYRLGGLDFAIVRLAGNPGDTFGVAGISEVDGAEGDMLCIIQHPAGVPKRIEAGPLYHLHDNRLGYDSIDTLGGSSGSGVLRESTGLIVGVHTNGGCSNAAGSHNHGVRITSIISNSPVIQGILNPKLKIADDIGTLKTIDDGTTLKIIDDPITLKFSDDVGSLKVLDDPITIKFSDDIATLKFVDDFGSFKQLDDVKQPGYDKNPATDGLGNWWNWSTQGQQAGTGSPFILSTPHHSSAWAGSFPDAYQAKVREYEQLIPKYESEIKRLNEAYEARQLDEQNKQLFERLVSEYKQIVSEYQQLKKR